MRRLLVVALIALPITLLATGGTAAAPDPPLTQQVAQLKAKLRAKTIRVSDLVLERDAQDALIEDQGAQIARLKDRLANPPDALSTILTRDSDGLWAAMAAIWRAFPTLDAGQLCGYDRSNAPGDGSGLTVTTYTFARWSGC